MSKDKLLQRVRSSLPNVRSAELRRRARVAKRLTEGAPRHEDKPASLGS